MKSELSLTIDQRNAESERNVPLFQFLNAVSRITGCDNTQNHDKLLFKELVVNWNVHQQSAQAAISLWKKARDA